MTEPAYISDTLVAFYLGRKASWLRNNRAKLEADGFPKKDKLVGMTMRADLEAWIEKRRRLSDPVKAPTGAHHNTTRPTGENIDAF